MTGCVKYHPAPEKCECVPVIWNGGPMVINTGGVKIPVMTDDVIGSEIFIDLSGCCDRVKWLQLADENFRPVIED